MRLSTINIPSRRPKASFPPWPLPPVFCHIREKCSAARMHTGNGSCLCVIRTQIDKLRENRITSPNTWYSFSYSIQLCLVIVNTSSLPFDMLHFQKVYNDSSSFQSFSILLSNISHTRSTRAGILASNLTPLYAFPFVRKSDRKALGVHYFFNLDNSRRALCNCSSLNTE